MNTCLSENESFTKVKQDTCNTDVYLYFFYGTCGPTIGKQNVTTVFRADISLERR